MSRLQKSLFAKYDDVPLLRPGKNGKHYKYGNAGISPDEP
jgi:hypothetical protein